MCAALMDAILADPENDGLRLVYADWLQENGDPRGEFIRAQVEVYQLEQSILAFGKCRCDEGSSYLCERCAAVQSMSYWAKRIELDQQQRLGLHNMRQEWVAGLPGRFVPGVKAFGMGRPDPHAFFERGFIAELWLPVAAFYCTQCDWCHGTGLTADSVRCTYCRNGRTTSLAHRLGGILPRLTRVTFSDASPLENVLHMTVLRQSPEDASKVLYTWNRSGIGGLAHRRRHDVPEELFQYMQAERYKLQTPRSGPPRQRRLDYDTEQQALDALSNAALRAVYG